MYNIFLTGSSGFLGKHIMRNLPIDYSLTCFHLGGIVNELTVPKNIDCVIYVVALKIGN